MYNANKDFTERDQILFNYRELEAKAIRSRIEKEQRDFNRRSRETLRETAKMAFRDGLFIISIIVFLIVTTVVTINIFTGFLN